MVEKIKLIFVPCQGNNYRPRLFNKDYLFYYLIILLALKIIVLPFFIYFPKDIFFAEIVKSALLNLTNRERRIFGLQSLRENPQLSKAAYLKAKDMMEKGYFSHYSPEGVSPWYWFKKVGYNYKIAGENLAIGFLDSEEVHQAWFNSPSHKENLLNPEFNEIGIAVLKGDFQGNETTVVVQLFGAPKAEVLFKKPPERVVPPQEKPKITPPKEEVLEEKEVLSKEELTPIQVLTFNLFQFISSKYLDLIQKIIYISLILVISLLFLTIFFDIFIYREFEIQYRDIVLNAFIFCLLLIVFLYLDKTRIIQHIPHHLRIY